MSIAARFQQIADLDLSRALIDLRRLNDETAQLATNAAAAAQAQQPLGTSRFIGTGPGAALNDLDAAAAGLTDALIENNAKIRQAYEDFVKYRLALGALETEKANVEGRLRDAIDQANRSTDPDERFRLKAEQSRLEQESQRIARQIQQQADQHAAQLAALKTVVAREERATGAQQGIEKRYEIQFKTPDGRTETVTTTTDPRAFLDALETARGVT